MRIDTSKFGEIDIEDEKILTFNNGILGFERIKRFTIISAEETLPFYWLQAVDDKDVALSCMNPYDIMPSYKPLIDEAALDSLEIEKCDEVLILTTVSVPRDLLKATTNLAAPIIINPANNKGAQIVLQNTEYELRHPVFSVKEDTGHADTVTEAE